MQKDIQSFDLVNLLSQAQRSNKNLVLIDKEGKRYIVIAYNGQIIEAYLDGESVNKARSYFSSDILPTIEKISVE
jgi:uncharacterized membrane protein YvbJ